MKKILLTTILIIFATCRVSIAEETAINMGKQDTKHLDLSQCIDIATYNNPKVYSSVFNTEILKSKIGQAKSFFYPQITADSSYNRINPSTENNFIDGSNNNFSTGIQLNQLIYDFGKTPTLLKINKLNFLSSSEDLKNTIREIIFNVKASYYQVLLSKEEINVLEESIKLYERFLEQAEGLYKAGFKAKIDIITAQVTLNNTKLDLIRAKNLLEIAKARLNNAMGDPDANNYILEGKLEYLEYNKTFEELLKEAYKTRPDLKAINIQKDSTKNQIKYEKLGYVPEINAATSYGARGRMPIDQNWSVGATISIPIFNGLLTHYKVSEAKATLKKKDADIQSLQQAIYLEIKEYFLSLNEIKQKIPLSELVVKQAKERLKIADKRYQIGFGNSIELKDAEIELRNARLSYFRNLYDYNIVIANIEKSIGSNLPNIVKIN